MPKKLGDCTITAAVWSSILLSRSSRSSAPVSRVIAELRHRHALVLGVGRAELRDIPDAPCAPPAILSRSGEPHRHHGRFRHRGRAVVHGCVGHVHAGQLADHGLKFEDRGERALRDFGLVGRVGSQKLAARDHRIHQHRPVVVVNARAQKGRVAVGVIARRGRGNNRRFRIPIFRARCRAAGPAALRAADARTDLPGMRAPIADKHLRGARDQTSVSSAIVVTGNTGLVAGCLCST